MSSQEAMVDGALLPFGATSMVGSLPHRDRQEAIGFVLERTPDLPAAPTLPAVHPLEGMLAQAAWGVPGLRVLPDGTFTVAAEALDPEAPTGDRSLRGEPFATWRAFLGAVTDRTGPIKVQLTGPVTFGFALVNAGVEPSLAYRVAAHAVTDRVRALLDLAAGSAPAAAPVVVFDEPALAGGMRPELQATADDVIDLLSGVLGNVSQVAVGGIHCCGPADWSVVLAAEPRLLSAPVGAGLSRSAGTVAGFLDRGGWIAWGAVPTAAPLGEQASLLWKALSSQWCELVRGGCDPVVVRQQTLITPECGLALHDTRQAEHVLSLCRQLSERLHDQALGVRLAVGA